MVLIGGLAVRRPAANMRPSSDRSAVLHGALMWLQNWIADGESALRLRTDLPYFAEHCLKLRTKFWRSGTVYLKSRAASAACFVRGTAGEDRTRSGCDT